MTFDADRRPAYRAARQWADSRGYELPDDRLVDAALDAATLPEADPDRIRGIEVRADAAGGKTGGAARQIMRSRPDVGTVGAVGVLLSEVQRWKDAAASERIEKDRRVSAARARAVDCDAHGAQIGELRVQSRYLEKRVRKVDAARLVLLGWYRRCDSFVRQARANQAAGQPLPDADTILGWMERLRPSVVDAGREAGLVDRPQVICLCGSTRFYEEFQRASYELTMAGHIVLSVGFYWHDPAGQGEGVGLPDSEVTRAAVKEGLDELHKRKIDMADSVMVVSDEAGYIGDSTRSEISYAIAHGKPVAFMHRAAGGS